MAPHKNSNINIRLATSEDAKKLNEIEKACFSQKLRYGPSILASLLSMTTSYITLAVELSNYLCGFAIGEQDEKKKSLGRIVTIQIDPFYQRRRLGSKLLGSHQFLSETCLRD